MNILWPALESIRHLMWGSVERARCQPYRPESAMQVRLSVDGVALHRSFHRSLERTRWPECDLIKEK